MNKEVAVIVLKVSFSYFVVFANIQFKVGTVGTVGLCRPSSSVF